MRSSENIKPDSAIEREPGSRPKSELEGGTTFLGSWWEKQVQEFQREVRMRENESRSLKCLQTSLSHTFILNSSASSP